RYLARRPLLLASAEKRARAVYSGGLPRRHRCSESHGCEGDGWGHGCVCEFLAHRNDFSPFAVRRRPDSRGEVRGVRDQHFLPDVSLRLVLRRGRTMGLDGLKAALLVGLLIFVAAACGGGGGRPKRLLSGAAAPELMAVPGSVVTIGRLLRRATLGS